MIVGIILACEVAFWVLVVAGLLMRYLVRRERLGAILLAATPVVDLILLIAAAVDIRRGAEFSGQHALAAIYLGCSIAFGADIIRWADRQVAQRFAGAPTPPKPTGSAHAARERRGWLKHALAWAIGSAVLGALYLIAGRPSDGNPYVQVALTWLAILGVDFLWSFSYTVFPRKA